MADAPSTSIVIKDFPGLKRETDVRDLSPGASDKQINAVCEDVGILQSRTGYAVVKFEGE
jgi:hypothetical protein|tara:strand:- start:42 stop:221 length:180 start_codon:yes stop_codon:yes gene_type:complete